MTAKLDEIIASLTETQRSGILRARPFAFGAHLLPLGSARGLAPLGLAVRTIDGMCLTPLGLAVRQALGNHTNSAQEKA